jgi:hypothetical protein
VGNEATDDRSLWRGVRDPITSKTHAPTAGQDLFAGATNVLVLYLADTRGWSDTYASRPTATWMLKPPFASWVTPSNTVSIFKYNGQESVLVIPYSIDGRVVTHIGETAFANHATLASVTIPNGVTTIGPFAFSACEALSNLVIGASVTTIGEAAFGSCHHLTSIKLPDRVTNIPSEAFLDCVNLTSVSIGKGVTNIGSQAFSFCGELASVSLPDQVVAIDKQAFYFCVKLKFAHLGKNLVSIGDAAFCLGRELTEVQMPATVASIGNSTFSGCKKLSNLELSAGLTNIGPNAFSNTAISQAAISPNVLSIGAGAFASCGSLTQIEVAPDNPNYASREGVLFDKNQTVLLLYPGGKTGAYAVPEGVTLIGPSAYFYTSNLTSLSLPDTLKSLASSSLFHCSGLGNLNLPAGLTNIDEGAISGCGGLTNITVDPDNRCFSSWDGALYNKEQTVLLQYPTGRIGPCRIPEGVKEMKYRACAWSAISSVFLPASLTRIDEAAFFNCSKLTSIYLPAGVSSIGGDAFNYCGSLASLYFAGNAPALGNENVFYGVSNSIVYYQPAKTGWDATYGGLPTQPWEITFTQWTNFSGLAEQFPNACGEPDDADHDGMSNLQEMYAGTDPTSAKSALAFESTARPEALSDEDKTPVAEDKIAFYIQTVPGMTYDLERCDQLNSEWSTATTVTATSTQKRVVLARPAGNAFYRVVVRP